MQHHSVGTSPLRPIFRMTSSMSRLLLIWDSYNFPNFPSRYSLGALVSDVWTGDGPDDTDRHQGSFRNGLVSIMTQAGREHADECPRLPEMVIERSGR